MIVSNIDCIFCTIELTSENIRNSYFKIVSYLTQIQWAPFVTKISFCRFNLGATHTATWR
jgi:hypothetical protein